MRRRRSEPRATGIVRLWGDESGIAVVWVTVGMFAIFGIGALLVDAGRMFNLHSQMQSYADHVALAAAAELDGAGDAIDRAIKTVTGTGPGGIGPLVIDTQNFASGSAALAINCLTFLSALGTGNGPAGTVPGDQVLCNTCGGTACNAAHSLNAQYVQASVQPRTMNYALALAGGTADVGSYAIAGFTRSVCNYPPLMFCNPDEAVGGGGEYTAVVGRQILLKSKGAGSAWGPGDFGLLDPPGAAGEPYCGGGGASEERCVLALVNPNTQCVEDKADIKPGEAVSVHAGLNTRFDIWDPPLNTANFKNNPAFAPARNVTKGKVFPGKNCTTNKLENPPPASPSVRMPRDPCFDTGGCTRFGNGNTALWAGGSSPLIGYWQTNHGANPPASFPTRYEAYRYEIDNNAIMNRSATGGENGNPSCSNQVDLDVPGRDRRVLIVAVINCIEQGINGAEDDVPIKAFAKVFMTEPVGIDSPSVDDVWVEELGVVKAGDQSGVLHDYPVLYR